MPLLAYVAIALTISKTEMSMVPKQMDGTGSIGAVMPIRRVSDMTASGGNCLIRNAVTQLMELAKAHRRLTISPSLAFEELVGHHSVPSGRGTQTGTLGTSVQGRYPPSCMAKV